MQSGDCVLCSAHNSIACCRVVRLSFRDPDQSFVIEPPPTGSADAFGVDRHCSELRGGERAGVETCGFAERRVRRDRYGTARLRQGFGTGVRGATWTNVTSAGAAQLTGAGFTSIAYSTDVTSVVVASVAGSGYASWFPNAYRGLIYSADGGHSWAQASVTDTGATVAVASATQVIYNRFTHKFYAALRYHGLYESSDGANFTRMAVQPFPALTQQNCPAVSASATCAWYRAQLAVQPQTQTMFVIAVDDQNIVTGIAMVNTAQLLAGQPWARVSAIDPTLANVNGAPTVPSGITECQGGVCGQALDAPYNLWI